MKPLTKSFRDKGWTAKDVAERWGMGKQRISQIAANPSQRDWDAAAGLPGKLPENFDDFEELFEGQKVSEVCSLLFSAAGRYNWSNEQIRELAESIITLLDFSESTRKMNKK